MTSWRVIRNPEDDVTAGHNFCIDRSQKFSSWGIEDRHEPVQINLGPNVGDITTGVTRPGGAGLRHNDHHVKPSTKLEDGGSVMGLRPGGGLRPVVINRHYDKTCSVRQNS